MGTFFIDCNWYQEMKLQISSLMQMHTSLKSCCSTCLCHLIQATRERMRERRKPRKLIHPSLPFVWVNALTYATWIKQETEITCSMNWTLFFSYVKLTCCNTHACEMQKHIENNREEENTCKLESKMLLACMSEFFFLAQETQLRWNSWKEKKSNLGFHSIKKWTFALSKCKM